MYHFDSMVEKSEYLQTKVVLEVDSGTTRHYKVNDRFTVWVTEHGKFNCDCGWGTLHIGHLCSHIMAVVLYEVGKIS